MPKCPKFIVDMKQPKRSPKHGNRRPSPQTNGSPTDGASNGAGGADTRPGTIPWVKPGTYNFARALQSPRIGSLTATEVQARRAAAMALMAQHMRAVQAAMFFLDDCVPDPKPLPYSIIQGELTGWRVWWIGDRGELRSYTMSERVWDPKEPMVGDVAEPVRSWGRGQGVYAFKDFEMAERMYRNSGGSFHGKALGTVKLWGKVIEHQGGYRAQFAKISGLCIMQLWHQTFNDPLEIYKVPIVTPPMPEPKTYFSNDWTGRDA